MIIHDTIIMFKPDIDISKIKNIIEYDLQTLSNKKRIKVYDLGTTKLAYPVTSYEKAHHIIYIIYTYALDTLEQLDTFHKKNRKILGFISCYIKIPNCKKD